MMQRKEKKNGQDSTKQCFQLFLIISGLAFCAPLNANENIANLSKSISVKIEGATQGSGVIVERVGNRYTILTAWHVIKSNKPGEEVAIYTSDGEQHQFNRGSIKRLGEVDMATISFDANADYDTARIGDIRSVSSGSTVYVSGFPLPTTSVPRSIWRFLKGDVIANAKVAITNGYQLLYSNPTLPGMSGGSVLNDKGHLIGIHGKSEKDDQISMRTGKAVSTGTNQAIPISYYKEFIAGRKVAAATSVASTIDDYVALARSAIFGDKADNYKAIEYASKALAIEQSKEAYFLRSIAFSGANELEKALRDITQAINLDNENSIYISNRAVIHARRGNLNHAINDFNHALEINPNDSDGLANRAEAHRQLGNLSQARQDIVKSLILSPNNAFALNIKGEYLLNTGRPEEALLEFNRAVKISPEFTQAYINKSRAHRKLGQENLECLSLVLAAGKGSVRAYEYITKPEQKWCINYALSVIRN